MFNNTNHIISLLGKVAVICAILLWEPSPTDAQYFGRNKVQYEDFDFEIKKTDHFDIHYYPAEEMAVADASRMAERWYTRLGAILRHEFKQKKPFILYANHADFQQTNTTGNLIPEGTGGFTESLKNRVVLPLTGIYANNDHVIGHEMVHAFQFDIMSTLKKRLSNSNRMPLWLTEGMAEYLSVGRVDPHTAMWLRDALVHDELPTIRDLSTDPRYFPYRFGHAFWAFLAGRLGDKMVSPFFATTASKGLNFAIKNTFGMSPDSLSQVWQQTIRSAYQPQIEGRDAPHTIGERILAKDKGSGSINISPTVSPDGKYVAFFSERDLFSIDLFLADAQTGEVIKKLASSYANQHFDALSFINAAGAWSPDSKRFAFVAYAEGDNIVVVKNVETDELGQRIRLDKVGAISHVAWSPDGQYLAISGAQGGVSDLYLYNFQTGLVSQLTDDKYADLQPAWSPEGQTIAFVSDRGEETDFERLSYSAMKIALIEPESKHIRVLDLFERGKHINPQFSPDGSTLYFISDASSFSDIYSVSLETNDISQITNIATGVSGITALSPAMSVARNSGRMLFTVFEKSNYAVHALGTERAPATKLTYLRQHEQPATLPPIAGTNGQVIGYLNDPYTGLPETEAFEVEDYNPKLTLDYIGQPTIGVAVDRFGTSLGGGISMYFSDMLGNQTLGTALQLNGSLKDIGAQAFYLNRDKRWNWGGSAGHIAYRSGFTNASSRLEERDGRTVVVETFDRVLQRVFVDRAAGILEYPLSTTRRFELSGGYTRYSFNQELQRTVVVDGVVADQTTQDLPAPGALNLFQSAVAYVGDNSFFGFTGPVAGHRFRFEVEPTLGTLTYVTILGDYRNYIFWRPLTVAFRAMHYGRYGNDAESNRLSPLFLGFETLVRGYSIESFSTSECTAGAEGCPVHDRLNGSRIGVMNLEARLPLLGMENLALVKFPFLPTDLIGFVDGGVAWTSNQSPTFDITRRSTERIPVFSAGVSTRFNILNALIFEVYYAYPFQRPDKGWHFGFQMAPGW